MKSRFPAWYLLTLLAVTASPACTRCEPPPTAERQTMPALVWSDAELPDYRRTVPRDPEQARRRGVDAIKTELAVPDALETRLAEEDLETWRGTLTALEKYRTLAVGVVQVATAPQPKRENCAPISHQPDEVLPLRWELDAHRLVQQRRNVLWRLGRLELAARSLHGALGSMAQAFGSERSRHAQEALLEPLARIRSRLEGYDVPETRPDGDWIRSEMYPRFERHRPVLLLVSRAEEALFSWRGKTSVDPRWSYAAASADAPLTATASWIEEHDALISALSSWSSAATALATTAGRLKPEDGRYRRCLILDLKAIARWTSILEGAVKMQRELAEGARWLRSLAVNLNESGRGKELGEVAALAVSIEGAVDGLMALESSALMELDTLDRRLWRVFFPNVLRSEAVPTLPNPRDAATWRGDFFDTRDRARPGRGGRAVPEPEQGWTRRGRPKAPFVSKILDLSRSPARVAEVEQGLLAISELDAHLQAMHSSISAACREGDCEGLPSPDVAGSPRGTAWVKDWRATEVPERTLGHNLIVLELARLHLARQVVRLAGFHGWFTELSNADITWEPLAGWEQTWSLYSGSRGSYLSYVASIKNLHSEVDRFANHAEAPRSDRVRGLLRYQVELFDDTVAYARFIDRGAESPVPIATVLSAWESLQRELLAIEVATLARDEKAEARRLEEKEREKARKLEEERKKRAAEEAERPTIQ